ncbi:hypothetical protein NUSPORA_02007 [Nucleospora cyclopteri]
MIYILLILNTIVTTKIATSASNVKNLLLFRRKMEFIECNSGNFFFEQFTKYFLKNEYRIIKESYLNQEKNSWEVSFDVYDKVSCEKTYNKIYICFYLNAVHNFGISADLGIERFIYLEPIDKHVELYKYMNGIHKIFDLDEFITIYDLLRANKQEYIALDEAYLDQKIIANSLRLNGGMTYNQIPDFIKENKKIKKVDLIKYIEIRNKITIDFKFLTKTIKIINKKNKKTLYAYIQLELDTHEKSVSLPIQCNLIKRL